MRRRPVTVDTGNMTGRTERVSNSGRQRGARARKKGWWCLGEGKEGTEGKREASVRKGARSGRIKDPKTRSLSLWSSTSRRSSSSTSQGAKLASSRRSLLEQPTGSTLPKQAKSRCAMVAVRGPSMIRPPQATRWEAHAGAEVCFSGFPPAGWWPLCVVGLVTPTRPLTSDDRVKWFGPLKGSRL